MDPRKRTAAIAGLLYLTVVLTGIIHLLYVPSRLIDLRNAVTTFNNISAHETLFRLSIVAGIICYIAFLFLPLALYRLLSPINKNHAIAMAALALVSVPIALINMLNKLAVLTLMGKANYLSGWNAQQLQTEVMLHLRYYNNGNQLTSIFWGLWLFPLGLLIFKSGYLPKVLGILLMFGCFGYLINFAGAFLFPAYTQSAFSHYITLPGSVGEIGTCIYLLYIGIRKNPLAASNTFV